MPWTELQKRKNAFNEILNLALVLTRSCNNTNKNTQKKKLQQALD